MIINRTQFAANTQRIEVFERAGIRVIVTDYHAMKLENHVLSTRIIGRMLGRDTVAEELCRKAIDGLKDVDARVARASAGKKPPKVYMELGSKGVGNYGNTYNSTILWGAMLARVGADSISANNREPYSAATREYVISQNPEDHYHRRLEVVGRRERPDADGLHGRPQDRGKVSRSLYAPGALAKSPGREKSALLRRRPRESAFHH